MLLEFSFENFLSFKDKTTISFCATRERTKTDSLSITNSSNNRILPITAVYGYNASGKSNLIAALNCVKNLIAHSNINATGVIPYKLDSDSVSRNTYFSVTFSVELKVYRLDIVLNPIKIISEELYEIVRTHEYLLYKRTDNTIDIKNRIKWSATDLIRLQFIMDGTKPYQLFLNNCASQQVNFFVDIVYWFKNNLVISSSATSTEFYEFKEETDSFFKFNELLAKLDLSDQLFEKIELERDSIPMVEQIENVCWNLPENSQTMYRKNLYVTKKEGRFVFSKVIAKHKKADNSFIEFDLNAESEGTTALLKMRPVLVDLIEKKRDLVFVVDELDKSLHPLLLRQLIKLFVDNCSNKTRTQLIFTCHDAMLLDQNLMRRDEYWIVNRNNEGSHLSRITDSKAGQRIDKQIRNAYMDGELGIKPIYIE